MYGFVQYVRQAIRFCKCKGFVFLGLIIPKSSESCTIAKCNKVSEYLYIKTSIPFGTLS